MQYQPFLLNELSVPVISKEAPLHDSVNDIPPEPSPEDIRAQAQTVLDEAKKRAEEIEREAYEQGFKQGEKDGQEIGSMKLVKILERIEQICEDLDSYHEKFVHLHEKELLSLIAAIAGKVLKVQVDMDPEAVKKSVMEALASASDWQEVTIRVDPTDFEFMDDMRPEFFEKVNTLRSINIVPDSSVEKGGCIISADFGEVDARIQSRLDKVAQAMMDVYYSRRV
ncbi:MAG: hypothetical protein JEZ02_04890 [Desulfatibacillum sp.]|nr:hypothetical protein [Desulfatibacillum sp.]